MEKKKSDKTDRDLPQTSIPNSISCIFAGLTSLIGILVVIGWITGKHLLMAIFSCRIPTTPSPAILFIIFSILIVFLHYCKKPDSMRLILLISGAFMLLVSIFLLIISTLEIEPVLHYFGFALSRTTYGTNTFAASPLTSICLILIGLALLGIIIDNREIVYLPLYISFSVIVIGIMLVIAYIMGGAILFNIGMKLPTPTSSIAIVMLGTGIFIPSLKSQNESGSIASFPIKKHALTVIISFFIVTGLFTIIGHYSLKSYRQILLKNVQEQLASITELKASELVSWLDERKGDASVYYNNENFSRLVESVLVHRNDPRQKEALQKRMWIERDAHFYDHVFMLDADHQLVQDAPNHNHEVPTQIVENAEIAIKEDRVVFVDFYTNSDGNLELAVLSPIFSNQTRKPLGTLCMTVDPNNNLLPNLGNWPNPYKTSKIRLLRIRMDHFRIIVPKSIPTDTIHYTCHQLQRGKPSSIADMIIDGKQGILEGLNLDNNHAIAMFSKVPDTPWFILSQIETSEIYTPLRERLWLLLIAQIIILLAATLIIEIVWRKHKNSILARQIVMQNELIKEKDKYKRTIDSLIEGFQILDRNWKYAYINLKAAEYGKNPPEDYIGKTVMEMYPGFEKSELFQRFEQCLQYNNSDHFEYEFTYPDNTNEWFLFSVQPTDEGLVILTSNITKRKRAEMRIDHLNRVLHSIRDVNQLIVHETEKNLLIQRACDILVQNQSYRNAIIVLTDENYEPVEWHTAGQEKPLEMMISMFEQKIMPPCYKGAINKGEFVCITGSEKACPTCPLEPAYSDSQSIVIKLDHHGTLFGILHVIMEENIITDEEEKDLIIELADDVSFALNMMRNVKQKQTLEQQLQQARKLEAIGRLAGGVAHDFNNMLQTILGYADFLLDEFDLSEEQTDFTLEIKNAARRSADLTYQLLAFSRKQTVELRVIKINNLIQEILKMLRRLIGEHIDLIWKPGDNLLSVRMDPSQINQILMNLTVNARDAIKGNGTIVIETDMLYLDEKEKLERFELEKGKYVVLSVSDTGEGIGKEDMDKIFEPFFTTKQLGQGTGLGLATIYGIVKQNRGNISVYSEPGKGSTFRVYLPAFIETVIEPQAVVKVTPPKGVETIMLVEDSEQLLNLSKRQLEKLGYKVIAFTDPEKALNTFDPDHKPDLLITDVIMPVMSGKELWDRLREKSPDLNCLFMSGYTSNVISHHGVLDEGINFISKPFSVKDIAMKIREILGKA